MKNLRDISTDASQSLRMVFTSQQSSLWYSCKLDRFVAANKFLANAFPHDYPTLKGVDIYVTKAPLFHENNIVYSTLVHADEQIGNFYIQENGNFIPFQVNADSPIIVINGKQDADGIQMSVVHECCHLVDEEPNSGSHGYMDSPREQRARASELAFLNWQGVPKYRARDTMQSRYEDAADMQI